MSDKDDMIAMKLSVLYDIKQVSKALHERGNKASFLLDRQSELIKQLKNISTAINAY